MSSLGELSVLAVGAHPDDIEILCGGTMAAYAAAGARVTFAIATNGEVGGREEPTAIAARRKQEALAACALIGAELIWMGFPDERLFNEPKVRLAFIEAYRRARADVIFVHSVHDYHPDHRVAGQIGLDARIPAAVPHVRTASAALERVPHMFVMDTLSGVDFEPDFLVEVSEHQDMKEEMLRRHASQVEWMMLAYGSDYIVDARRQARLRAEGAGWDHAEGFCSVRTFPVTGGPDLLPGPWRTTNANGGDHPPP